MTIIHGRANHWRLFVVKLACLFWLLVSPAHARLEAAAILPHGDVAFDPSLLPLSRTDPRKAADEIANASRLVGEWLGETVDPDLILLSTPHGIMLDEDFGIYLGPSAAGCTRLGRDLPSPTHEYDLCLRDLPLHTNASQSLLDYLQGENVSGIRLAPDGTTSVPLFWGEIIPLSLIHPRSNANDTTSDRASRSFENSVHLPLLDQNVQQVANPHRGVPRQHVIWSYPQRRFDHAVDMVTELLRVGGKIRSWMDQMDDSRIALLVSGDLSHTHEASGPYGFAPESAWFDHALTQWANTTTSVGLCDTVSAAWLLERARQLQPRAMSCGFTGFVLLHGVLCPATKNSTAADGSSSSSVSKRVLRGSSRHDGLGDGGGGGAAAVVDAPHEGEHWDGRVWVNRNATYYGMMAATFQQRTREPAS